MDWFQKQKKQRFVQIKLWIKGKPPPKPKKTVPIISFGPPPSCDYNMVDTCGRHVPKFKVKLDAKTFDDGLTFASKLRKKGFVRLGSGCFSTVLARPGKDRVIKITHQLGDGWIDYIQWAGQNGYAGGFAPRVYSYKYIKAKEPFSIAVVERMDHLLYNADKKGPIPPIMSLLPHAANDNDMAKSMLDLVAPGLVKFRMELQAKFKYLDLHGGNVMVKGDRICFTDPVGGHGSGSVIKTRLRSSDFEKKIAA